MTVELLGGKDRTELVWKFVELIIHWKHLPILQEEEKKEDTAPEAANPKALEFIGKLKKAVTAKKDEAASQEPVEEEKEEEPNAWDVKIQLLTEEEANLRIQKYIYVRERKLTKAEVEALRNWKPPPGWTPPKQGMKHA